MRADFQGLSMSIARLVPAILAALLAVAPTLSSAQSSPVPERRGIVHENIDFFGGDLRMLRDTTLEICTNACLSDPACQALTFNTSAAACFLKTGLSERMSFIGAVSVEFVATDPAVLAQAPARAADLSFIPDYWMTQARDTAVLLGRD